MPSTLIVEYKIKYKRFCWIPFSFANIYFRLDNKVINIYIDDVIADWKR